MSYLAESKEKKLMSRNEAAEMFGVTPQTISNWHEEGLLQGTLIKGNRFITVESVNKLMDLYPDASINANRVDSYRSKIETLQNELAELKDNLRRERIYRNYAPRYMKNFVEKFIHLMKKMSVSDYEHLLQEQFIHCWLFGHDIGELCKENNISYNKYATSIRQYVRALRYMDDYAGMVERNRILEEENKTLKAENQRLVSDMEEYRSRFAAVNNAETWKDKYPVLTKDIMDLDFTVRTLNILKSNNFKTLGQVVRYSKFDLLKMRNFGKKSLYEIMDFLEPYGLELGMDLDMKCDE